MQKISRLFLSLIFILAPFGAATGCKTSQKNQPEISQPATNLEKNIQKDTSQNKTRKKNSGVLSTVTKGFTGVVNVAGNLAVGAGSLAVAAVGKAGSIAKSAAGAAVSVTKGALHEAAKLVGLIGEKKNGWQGIVTRMPFRHTVFGEIKNTEIRKSYHPPRALVLSSKIDLQKYLMLHDVSDVEIDPSNTSQVDLVEELESSIYIGYADEQLADAQHVQISRVDEGEFFTIHVTVMIPAFGCGMLYVDKRRSPMHLIKLNKSDLIEGSLSLKKTVKVVKTKLVEYCPQPYANLEKVNPTPIEFRRYFKVEHPKNRNDVLATVFPMSDTWGQWDMFTDGFCGGCEDLVLPAGYPNKIQLIAVMDQLDFSAEMRGYRNFTVKGLYEFKGSLVVDARRTVSLCDVESTKTLEILEIQKSEISWAGESLRREQVLFSGPLIPEDQVACQEVQGR